ncbi:hypothetical protein SALBM311S_04721 [Streptomyces alboniger]
MASPASLTRCHRASGSSMPPGKRQLIATMAIGSSSAAVARPGAVRDDVESAASEVLSSVFRCRARASGFA